MYVLVDKIFACKQRWGWNNLKLTQLILLACVHFYTHPEHIGDGLGFHSLMYLAY
jgi:hypothetical protein